MRATQARVAVLAVLGLLLACAAAVPAAAPALRGQLIPPLRVERSAVDPSEGAAELAAWSQADNDARVRAYLAAEHQRQVAEAAERAADARRAADAARAQQRAARSATAPRGGRTADAATWAALRQCENGGSYRSAPGDKYRGAYQFLPSTWHALGYSGDPADAPPEVQDAAAAKNLAVSGWGQWPRCARRLGLR